MQHGTKVSEGQHQMSLTQLGVAVSWPQYGDLPPPPAPGELTATLGVVGNVPHVARCCAAVVPLLPEVTPELAAAQSLVCHSLRHTPSLQHDFKLAR